MDDQWERRGSVEKLDPEVTETGSKKNLNAASVLCLQMLLMSFFPFVVFMREPRGLLSQNHLQVGGLETHPSLSLHRVALVLSSRFTSSFGEDARHIARGV